MPGAPSGRSGGIFPTPCEKLRNSRWFSGCGGCTVEGEGEAPDLLLENV